jgi:hypothetical protein
MQRASGRGFHPGWMAVMGLMHAKRDVTGMIHSGTPFDAIEDQIQQMPGLVDNERSALWLYAWSRQGSRWQRDAASQLLVWVESER